MKAIRKLHSLDSFSSNTFIGSTTSQSISEAEDYHRQIRRRVSNVSPSSFSPLSRSPQSSTTTTTSSTTTTTTITTASSPSSSSSSPLSALLNHVKQHSNSPSSSSSSSFLSGNTTTTSSAHHSSSSNTTVAAAVSRMPTFRTTLLPEQIRKLPFLLEKVIDDPEANNQFMTYLRKGQCQDELLFLNALRMMSQCNNQQAKRKCSLDIFNRFILRDSPQEINLSNTVRTPVEQHFVTMLRMGVDKVDSQIDVRRVVFRDAELSVMHMLNNHSFPLWRSSEEFMHWILRKSTDYILDLTDTTLGQDANNNNNNSNNNSNNSGSGSVNGLGGSANNNASSSNLFGKHSRTSSKHLRTRSKNKSQDNDSRGSMFLALAPLSGSSASIKNDDVDHTVSLPTHSTTTSTIETTPRGVVTTNSNNMNSTIGSSDGYGAMMKLPSPSPIPHQSSPTPSSFSSTSASSCSASSSPSSSPRSPLAIVNNLLALGRNKILHSGPSHCDVINPLPGRIQLSKYSLDPTLNPQITDRDIAFLLQSIEITDLNPSMMTSILKCNMNQSDAVQNHPFGGYASSRNRSVSNTGFTHHASASVASSSSAMSPLIPQNCQIYNKRINLDHDCKDMMLIKREARLNYPLDAIVNTKFDIVVAGDFLSETNIPVDYIQVDPSKGYSLAIQRRTVMYQCLKKFQKRDYCIASTAVRDAETNSLIIVHKSCTHRKVLTDKKWQRAYTISAEVYQPVSNHETLLTEVMYVSRGGLSKKLMAKYAKLRAETEYEDLMNRLQKNYSRGFPAPTRMHAIGFCLKNFVATNRGCTWTDVNKAMQLV